MACRDLSIIRTAVAEARVTPDGPAAGVLLDGDVVVAVDGRRVDPLSPMQLNTFIVDRPYTVTVRRDDAEETVSLTRGQQHSEQQRRLSASVLASALVWCISVTVIALLRPDQIRALTLPQGAWECFIDRQVVATTRPCFPQDRSPMQTCRTQSHRPC